MTYQDINVKPIETESSFRMKAYKALKAAIMEMDIYSHSEEIRLEERQLSEKLGVSRTPIREAMTLLEQEGFVRSVPRRGIFVVRKTRQEILEMITVWAALEAMAARLACEVASEGDIRKLRENVQAFANRDPEEFVSEYSEANLAFHKQIIRMSGCSLIAETTESLFPHMRGVRKLTIGQDHRAQRSILDHTRIVEAIEKRDADLAERLVREHTLGLARHVEEHGEFLN
ncbi:GntR family transcriptional regulator [Aquabacter cavernae]|uniref:GntR family transcriptional regulator n=1 Tax=Aquabacter cavernae TaxID=2496029 RepID=UPI000F8F5445|nr:GntR family transcriptional regulator [Aquabacter cavernae]